MSERHWSDWIEHDDMGWPKGVEPDEIVRCMMCNGDILSDMPASDFSWCFPGDAVRRYRRRIYPKALKIEIAREKELAE